MLLQTAGVSCIEARHGVVSLYGLRRFPLASWSESCTRLNSNWGKGHANKPLSLVQIGRAEFRPPE